MFNSNTEALSVEERLFRLTGLSVAISVALTIVLVILLNAIGLIFAPLALGMAAAPGAAFIAYCIYRFPGRQIIKFVVVVVACLLSFFATYRSGVYPAVLSLPAILAVVSAAPNRYRTLAGCGISAAIAAALLLHESFSPSAEAVRALIALAVLPYPSALLMNTSAPLEEARVRGFLGLLALGFLATLLIVIQEGPAAQSVVTLLAIACVLPFVLKLQRIPTGAGIIFLIIGSLVALNSSWLAGTTFVSLLPAFMMLPFLVFGSVGGLGGSFVMLLAGLIGVSQHTGALDYTLLIRALFASLIVLVSLYFITAIRSEGEEQAESLAGYLKRSRLVISATVMTISLVATVLVALVINDAAELKTINDTHDELQRLEKLLIDRETGQRGYLLTNNKDFLDPYYAAEEPIDHLLEQLSLNTAPEFVTQLRERIQARHEYYQLTFDLLHSGSSEEVLALVSNGEGKRYTDSLRALIDEMDLILVATEERLAHVIVLTALVMVVALLFLVIFAFILGRRARDSFSQLVFEPLSLLNRQLELVATNRALRITPSVTGATEIGLLTRTADRMQRQISDEVERLNQFIDGLGPDFLAFRHDLDRKFTWLKGNFQGITGVSIDEALGKPFAEVVTWDPVSLDQAHEMARRTFAEPQATTHLIRIQRLTDSRWLTLELSSHPVMNESGEVIAIEGIARDVTERTLRQRELELQDLTLNGAKIATFVVDALTDKFIEANAAASLLLTGSADKSVIGRSPFEFNADPAQATELKEAIIQSDGEAVTRIIKLNVDTGATVFVEMSSVLRTVDGAPRVFSFAVDRTEKVKAEALREKIVEQLEAASVATGLGIFEHNFASGEVICNERLRHIYGLPADAQLYLRDLTTPFHPEDAGRVSAYIKEHSQTLEGSNIEYRILVDGQTKWCRAATRYIKNALGETVSTVAVLDITSEKLREAELQSSLAELRGNREKQAQMLSIVSHELRTPLSSSHMIYDQLNTANLDQYLPVLKANSESVLAIMDDLRMVIQPDTVRVKEKTSDNPALVIERTLTSLQNLAERHRVVTHTAFDELAAQEYIFNTASLRQIITNLAKNALLHAEARNLWVSATATRTPFDKATAELTVSVEDDGKGISEAFQQTMYEAFSRGETSSDGTGLGLYIIKELAESLDGEIAYFTSPKGGAGFKLTVSLAPASEQANSNEPTYSEEQLKQTLAGKKVLFAEDQLTIQLLTKNILTKAGAEVSVASNGQLALAAYSEASPDIVITDVMMPDMDGYQLSAQLRKAGYTGPIIAVTAATIGDERDRLVAAGADVVMSKPININKLKLALADWEQNREPA